MSARHSVLAVDDSSFTLTIVSTYLAGSEFEVVATARNGIDALDRFRELKPDVVLLDLVMPGLSGQETLREILSMNPAGQVIMVSSLGTEDAVQECLTIGAKGFLPKPFTKDDLLMYLNALEIGL